MTEAQNLLQDLQICEIDCHGKIPAGHITNIMKFLIFLTCA